MTISSETRKAGPFIGNGATVAFPFTFRVFEAANVAVIHTDSNGAESTLLADLDYVIAINGDQISNPGGIITYPHPDGSGSKLSSSEKITLLSDVDYMQQLDITNGGGFYPEVIENALDKITMQIQQVREMLGRAFVVSVSSGLTPEDYLGEAESAANAAAASAADAAASAASIALPLSITSGGTGASNAAAAFSAIKQQATTGSSGVAPLATGSEAQAGLDNTKIITPAALNATVLGMGQTWQNVTGSRAIATPYKNLTGRPIQLSVAAGISMASAWLSLIVDGTAVTRSSGTYAVGAGVEITGVVIPADSTYSVVVSAGVATIQTWCELR